MKKLLEFYLALMMAGGAAAWADEFDSKGVKIHYTVEGKGEPVILIHGLMASGSINWEWPGIVAALTTEYLVITLDCRGHGLSDKPIDPKQYGLKMIEDVIGLMDHLKIKEANLVGYSMGGMITMKLLALHPERVHSAVIGGMGWLREFNGWPGFSASRGNTNAIQACVKGFAGLVLTQEEIRKIKTPMVVIVGERDPLRQVMVQPFRRLRPDVPVKVIAQAGHIDCCLKPKFKAELKEFLEKNGAGNGR